MKPFKRIIARFKKLRTKDKIMAVAALTMTLAVLVAIPTMAWFAHQKELATMAKVNSPAKLSLKSGAGEDIVQFKMAGIDAENGAYDSVNNYYYKDFVFSVDGEDISSYKIQIAHTTNINFTYYLYKATPSETGVEYKKEDRSKAYYRPAEDYIDGTYINKADKTYNDGDNAVTRKIGTDGYESPSYDNSDSRQEYAEPLYWQTSSAITANATAYDDDDDEKAFRNYYILRVTWKSDVKNDKETDLIYITAEVA